MSNAPIVPPNELAMQQAWRFRLWGSGRMQTSQGTTVDIIEAGKLNNRGGPDFHDARIRIDDALMVGCVEIHQRASDWHRHGHDGDSAYDNVILHVVGQDDCRIMRGDREIPQVVMRIDGSFAEFFNRLLNSYSYVLPMCGGALADVLDIFKTDWLTALAFERLLRKSNDVSGRLEANAGDWFQTVYVTLARGLGFGNNADNMERTARSVPFRVLLKHSDSIETVEAILFGQAGLLNPRQPADGYEEALCREYAFYSRKYNLKAITSPVWQMSTRSAANTPFRRIALLARLICTHGTNLGNRLCERVDMDRLRSFLCVPPSEYWCYNYAFGRRATSRMTSLGRQSQDLLIINVLAPLVYARALETSRTELMDFAVSLWENTPAEQNGITRGFEKHGIKADDAFTSQALIQLHRQYCERRRCPECRLGHRLLSSHITISGK